MENIRTHIGKMIRYYRKARKMTISELSKQVYKSKSSISKYENGEVAIDIDTLYDIAGALKVPLSHLVDYIPGQSTVLPGNTSGTSLNGFFYDTDLFYMYCMYFGRLYQSMLKIRHEEKAVPTAALYFDIQDFDRYYDCRCLYHGVVSASSTHVNFHMVNEVNAADEINMVFINLFFKAKTTNGILTSVSEQLVSPCSVKVVLSPSILPADESLREQLCFSKDEIRSIRSTNMFLIDRSRS